MLRYAQHYAGVATQIGNLNESDLEASLALFDRERIHLDTAWAWATQDASDRARAEIIITLGDGLRRTGTYRYERRNEYIPRMQAILIAAQLLGNRAAEARALHSWGNAHYLLGEFAAAESQFERALTIARELDIRKQQADLINNLGLINWQNDDTDRALLRFAERIQLAQELKDIRGEAAGESNLGVVHTTRQEFALAFLHLNRYLELAQTQLNDPAEESTALSYLADAFRESNARDAAIAHYERALAIDVRLGDAEGQARNRWFLGSLLKESEPQRAYQLMKQAYQYIAAISHPRAQEYKPQLEALRQQLASDESP